MPKVAYVAPNVHRNLLVTGASAMTRNAKVVCIRPQALSFVTYRRRNYLVLVSSSRGDVEVLRSGVLIDRARGHSAVTHKRALPRISGVGFLCSAKSIDVFIYSVKHLPDIFGSVPTLPLARVTRRRR